MLAKTFQFFFNCYHRHHKNCEFKVLVILHCFASGQLALRLDVAIMHGKNAIFKPLRFDRGYKLLLLRRPAFRDQLKFSIYTIQIKTIQLIFSLCYHGKTGESMTH